MAEIRIQFKLPYSLHLADGEYATGKVGDTIRLSTQAEEPKPSSLTSVSAVFTSIYDLEFLEEDERVRQVNRLLIRANRLIRWYRAISRDSKIAELTRFQASPFVFCEIKGGQIDSSRSTRINYEEPDFIPPIDDAERLTAEIRKGLSEGSEPPVETLFLLDAEQAVEQGRFRETVLFCWSTIDNVFNQKYDSLVDRALQAEWGEARDSLKSLDLGLRTKMSAIMHFLAGRSLFQEPGYFWDELSASYKTRNAIIHSGANANEDDARKAIRVAKSIVAVMNSIPLPAENE